MAAPTNVFIVAGSLFTASFPPQSFEDLKWSWTINDFKICWQSEKIICFIPISTISLFSLHTGAYFFIAKCQKSSLPQPPICLSDLTETSSRFTEQDHQRFWHTRRPWPNIEVLLESVLRGLCRVERAVGGKSSSPFTTFSTQHGQHTLVYGVSPSRVALECCCLILRSQCNILIWTVWGHVSFIVRVGWL